MYHFENAEEELSSGICARHFQLATLQPFHVNRPNEQSLLLALTFHCPRVTLIYQWVRDHAGKGGQTGPLDSIIKHRYRHTQIETKRIPPDNIALRAKCRNSQLNGKG